MNASAGNLRSDKLRRYFLWVLLMLVCAFTFRNYWAESESYHRDPSTILDLANGTGPAPAQYRVGIVMTAKQLVRLAHGHISYRHIFAAFDFIFALLAALLVFGVLERSQAFREAGFPSRSLRTVIALGLCTYYMWWSLWYLRPETWACVLFVAAALSLLCFARSAAVVIAGMIALAVLQGFIRADVAIIFDAAVFVYALLRGQKSFLISRGALLAASGVSCAIALAAQWLLMHRIYPHASYGDTAVFQLPSNLHPVLFVPCLIFIVPTVFTFLRGSTRDSVGEGQGHALLFACVLYFAAWMLVGRLREVRIYIPFAFALIPQTANAFANLLESNGEGARTA